jgi:hypothetical protein
VVKLKCSKCGNDLEYLERPSEIRNESVYQCSKCRRIIAVEKQEKTTNKPVFTKQGTKIARNYKRIVHGGRGDYIEIEKEDIIMSNLTIPRDEEWRINDDKCYYIWYQTKDGVKVYYQKRTVNYADYKLGYFYVSPRSCKDFDIGLEKWINIENKG